MLRNTNLIRKYEKMKKIVQTTNYKLQDTTGTTLVELLVAMSIFVIFVTVAVGGFIQAIANQRVVLKLNAATENMSLTLEQMMREMRVGTNFSTNGQTIQFSHYDSNGNPETIEYYLAPAPWDATQQAIMETITDNNGISTSNPITADNVNVSYFKTSVTTLHTPGPSRIGITLGITASDRGISVTNYIQTTVSSRAF